MVCEKNTHAMTPVVVSEKSTHAMTLVDTYAIYPVRNYSGGDA